MKQNVTLSIDRQTKGPRPMTTINVYNADHKLVAVYRAKHNPPALIAWVEDALLPGWTMIVL